MTKIICFDVETSGLCPFSTAMCSITMKVVGEEILKTIYIKPQEKLIYHPKAMEVNGLSKKFLETQGMSEIQAIDQIIDFIKTNAGWRPIFLAHNIIFDAQFTNALFKRNGRGLFMDLGHYHPIDTMILMKGLKDAGIVNPPKLKLTECYKYFFGKDFDNAHTSEADVRATEQVYLKIIETLKNLKE